MPRGFILLLITAAFLSITTYGLVRYAQGYRLIFNNNGRTNTVKLASTGLLVATSTPDGASVYIDNNLTSATNTTIDLPPGEYTVKIVKEGYLPWEKRLKIQKEVVTQTQALLFPSAPRLESLTTAGVRNPTVDPAGSSIAFGVASASAIKKNGIFVLDMNSRPILMLRNSSLQIADNSTDSFSSATYTWSPDGQELLAQTARLQATYKLKTNEFNEIPSNITAILALTKTQYELDKTERENARLDGFKPELSDFIQNHFTVTSWSNDDTKVLYEASESAEGKTIPAFIDPPLVGANTQKEERELQKGRLYVYDTKEDKNFFLKDVGSGISTPIWFPDNRHLVFIEDRQIKIIEYDGTNKTVVYSGPLEGDFVYPWPDGSRLVILTSLNSQGGVGANLYTINLK